MPRPCGFRSHPLQHVLQLRFRLHGTTRSISKSYTSWPQSIDRQEHDIQPFKISSTITSDPMKDNAVWHSMVLVLFDSYSWKTIK